MAKYSFVGFYAVLVYFFYRSMVTSSSRFESVIHACQPDYCWFLHSLYSPFDSPGILYFFVAVLGFFSSLLNMRYNSQLLRALSFLCLMGTIYRGSHAVNSLAIGALTLACLPQRFLKNKMVLSFEIFMTSFMSGYYLSGLWKLWGILSFFSVKETSLFEWLQFSAGARENWLSDLLVQNNFLGVVVFTLITLVYLSSAVWAFFPKVILAGVLSLIFSHVIFEQVFVATFRENILVLIFCFLLPLLISRREAN